MIEEISIVELDCVLNSSHKRSLVHNLAPIVCIIGELAVYSGPDILFG